MKQLKKFLWDSGFKCKKKMSDSSRVFRHYIRPVDTKEEVILILYKYKKMEDKNYCTYIEIIWVEYTHASMDEVHKYSGNPKSTIESFRKDIVKRCKDMGWYVL